MQDRYADLRAAIEKSGYYPDVVADSVNAAVAGEGVVWFLVHHEPTIDREEVRRHVTVVVLTPSRLILAHTDEHEPDDLPGAVHSTSTEAVMLPRALGGSTAWWNWRRTPAAGPAARPARSCSRWAGER
jgi:hypothetical protein